MNNVASYLDNMIRKLSKDYNNDITIDEETIRFSIGDREFKCSSNLSISSILEKVTKFCK